jgi:hypothetical protein
MYWVAIAQKQDNMLVKGMIERKLYTVYATTNKYLAYELLHATVRVTSCFMQSCYSYYYNPMVYI